MSDTIRPTSSKLRDPLVDGERHGHKAGPDTSREKTPNKRVIRLGDDAAQGVFGGEASQVSKEANEHIFGQAPAHLQNVVRRPDGWILTTDRQTGEVLEETDTQMCVHCQMHWPFKPGSGVQRGYCYRCNGLLCGKEFCMISCNPFEAVIELKEAEYREICRRIGISV